MASNLRSIVLITHRWIGLSSSLVLSIAGVSGAVLLLPGNSPLRRIAGPLHERLWLGEPGWWMVVAGTIAAVFLELGGLYLWWKRRVFTVRFRSGWWRAVFDLHHVVGLLGL